MSLTQAFTPLMRELDRWQAAGRIADFWLRDDDATEPSPALDRLLALCAGHGAPVTLAVIPAPTGDALVQRLATAPLAEVAVHGWAHVNHAPPSEKKQELGGHRPASVVLAELQQGFAKLQGLHAARFAPLLVPPWNRIDRALLPELGGLGFRALSVFGPEKGGAMLEINTHVDLIDWHGTRGGRPPEALVAEIVAQLQEMETTGGVMGFLTHHLVHDETAWAFCAALLSITAGHPACRWRRVAEFTDR